jgi:NTE family protein
MTRHIVRLVLSAIAAGAWSAPASAQRSPDATEAGASRPRIGLALSGGGARGGAHIGVLLALRDLGIPIDYVAGTSMGAVIGSLYASGLDEDELEATAREIDWATILEEQVDRDDRSFHRKRDDELYLVKQRAGFNDGQLELPLGLIQGQSMDLLLGRLMLPVSHVEDFDDLAVPFRAVAADVVTGEAVVLERGSLARAVRASLSLPAVFAPVEIDGRLLVDGGIAQNLPVETVRAMGADIVIAVDISTPLATREELTSVLSIASQLTGFLTTGGTAAQIEKLGPGDVLIRPELGDITTTGFERIAETFPIGYAATMQMAEQLRTLALAPEPYQAHRNSRPTPRTATPPQIDFVRLENESRVANSIIEARLEDIPTGVPLDVAATESAIAKVYGLQVFQNVRYSVVEENGQNGLEIEVEEREWGPSYLQAGIEYNSAGDDNTQFGLYLSYLRTAMNSAGAEWRSTLGLGDEPSVATEWHQPYGRNAMYFSAAGLKVESPLINVFEGEQKIAQVQMPQSTLNVAVGREFGNWGELRLGLDRGVGDSELVTGDQASIIPGEFDRGELFTRFSIDTLDSLYFPSRGGKVIAEWGLSRDSLGADQNFDQIRLNAIGAKTFGSSTLFGLIRYNSTMDGVSPPQDLFRIGGFFNLSGFAKNELTGQHTAHVLAGFHRRLSRAGTLPLYAGITLEKGNAWDNRSEMSLGNSLQAGSLWVGADTPIGPLYFAYGAAEGGRNSVYIFLGSTF